MNRLKTTIKRTQISDLISEKEEYYLEVNTLILFISKINTFMNSIDFKIAKSYSDEKYDD